MGHIFNPLNTLGGPATSGSITVVNESMAVTPTTGTLHTDTGDAGWNAGGYYLLTDGVNQHTQFYYTGDITSNFTMSVDMAMSTTSGADETFFFWGCNTLPQTSSDVGNIGYIINRNDFGNTIELWFQGTKLNQATYTKDTSFDTLHLIQRNGAFTVNYKGSLLFNYTDPGYPETLPGTLYGWGARCGGSGNTHTIKNLLVTKP